MKNIISIISEQLIPNYIFIKEIAKPGDNLIFISTVRMKNRLEILKKALINNNYNYSEIIFNKDGDENDYTEMYNQIDNKLKEKLNTDSEIIANLTGGTKFISIILKEVLEKEYVNSKFYYIPLPKNQIIPLEKNKTTHNIQYRVNIEEYLKAYGINKFSIGNLIENEDYTKKFFNKFKKLKGFHYQIINNLRKYRNDRRKTPYLLNEIINGIYEKPPIPDIKDFLDFIKFPLKNKDAVYCDEVAYLTGGWFEEYTFNLIKEKLNPDNIFININIHETDKTNMNELDVAFTLGNKLFIIECKTGIEKQKDLTDIVYKASALKDVVLGKLGANSYIFSLKKEEYKFTQIAKKMGITYCSEDCFKSEEKLDELLKEMKNKANI